jgi:hypothetical protein
MDDGESRASGGPWIAAAYVGFIFVIAGLFVAYVLLWNGGSG